jgi:hypothetical protein
MSVNIEEALYKEGFVTAFLIGKMKRECPTKKEYELHNRIVGISKLNTNLANNSIIINNYLNKEDVHKFIKVVYIPETLKDLIAPETDFENFEDFGNIYQELSLKKEYQYCSPYEKYVLVKENAVTDDLKFNQKFVHGWETETIEQKNNRELVKRAIKNY